MRDDELNLFGRKLLTESWHSLFTISDYLGDPFIARLPLPPRIGEIAGFEPLPKRRLRASVIAVTPCAIFQVQLLGAQSFGRRLASGDVRVTLYRTIPFRLLADGRRDDAAQQDNSH
jgi:hypothetical protein